MVALDRVLAGWADALREILGGDLAAAALFGSRARDDAGPDSDWDVLVLVRSEPADELATIARARIACGERTGTTPTLLLRSVSVFESSFPAIYLDIAEDARVFAGGEYLEPKLARIRQIAREAGLERVRDGRGLRWAWQKPPKGPGPRQSHARRTPRSGSARAGARGASLVPPD